MSTLSADQVRALRLRSLLLHDHQFTTPEAIVGWFGAMQAQDLGSVKWSLGLRLPGITESAIDQAIERGDVMRTWPMRGTIHLISAHDARWMLRTVGARQLGGVEKRWERLGLDAQTVARSDAVLADALAGGKRLTRSQASSVLNDVGVDTNSQRLYHLLWHAAQVGITCIGPNLGSEQTFVLLDDWAPNQRELTGDEALAELAWFFVRGRGPVLATDFSGWAGIPVGAARKALAANDGRVVNLSSEFGELWLTEEQAQLRVDPAQSGDVWALPGFDEFMLGYKKRDAIIGAENFDKVVPGGNGVFRPTIVSAGSVVGTWTRAVGKRKVRVSFSPFGDLSRTQVARLQQRMVEYGQYLQLPVELP